jgi:hypothetical protein
MALTLEAENLFDGAAKAIEQWSKLWWFDPATLVVVRSGDKVWTVQQDAVRRWTARRGL